MGYWRLYNIFQYGFIQYISLFFQSPTGSISEQSDVEKKVVYRSRSKEGSVERSRSPSPHKIRKNKGYSRSR